MITPELRQHDTELIMSHFIFRVVLSDMIQKHMKSR